ncbi:MAG: VTT domain-containing protein [Candidatus Dormibacteria bacterium]
MSFLQGLHGTIGVLLLCGLLFVEEAGVPLPFAPGELTLVAGGLLIASGGLNAFIFVPLAIVACCGGSMVGYSWARLVGEHGLREVARKLHQEKNLDRVSSRVRAGGARGIAVSRSIIGLRIYTTLVAGAAGVPTRTFVAGMVPATAAWVIVFVVLGALVGIPVEHFLNQFQKLLLQGVILVAIGAGGYFAARRAPRGESGTLLRVPHPIRVAAAVALDAGIVASVVAGVLSVVRTVAHFDLVANWADGVISVVMIVVFYLVVTWRGTGVTVGEALFSVDYISRLRAVTPGLAHEDMNPADDQDREFAPAAQAFRALGDVRRLRIVRALAGGDHSVPEIAARSGIDEPAVLYDLAELEQAGVVRAEVEAGQSRYRLDERVGADLLSFAAAG